MKKNATLLLWLTCFMTLFTACAKQDSATDEPPVTVAVQSTVSASGISKGSTATFSLASVSASAVVNWSSKPDTGLTISASGNTASVLFRSSGTYTITGTSGSTVGSTSVTVKDSGSAPASSYKDLAFHASEELNLTARKLGDTLASSGIQIGGYTTMTYPCGSWTKFSQQVSGTTLTITYQGLLEALQPCTGAAATVYIGGGGITKMSPGATYSLVIQFKGAVYTGSITKSNTGGFTITWPYTTGVKISPLTL